MPSEGAGRETDGVDRSVPVIEMGIFGSRDAADTASECLRRTSQLVVVVITRSSRRSSGNIRRFCD